MVCSRGELLGSAGLTATRSPWYYPAMADKTDKQTPSLAEYRELLTILRGQVRVGKGLSLTPRR